MSAAVAAPAAPAKASCSSCAQRAHDCSAAPSHCCCSQPEAAPAQVVTRDVDMCNGVPPAVHAPVRGTLTNIERLKDGLCTFAAQPVRSIAEFLVPGAGNTTEAAVV